MDLPFGDQAAALPARLLPYEEGAVVQKPISAGFGFGPLPILLVAGPGPAIIPSRWAVEKEQSSLLRAIGWPARFVPRNVMGALDKPDWTPYIDRNGPLQWPEYEAAPVKASSSKPNTGKYE